MASHATLVMLQQRFWASLAISAREAKSAASSKFEKKVLQRVDERPIRGEFKVWIWKNYLNYPLPTLPPDG